MSKDLDRLARCSKLCSEGVVVVDNQMMIDVKHLAAMVKKSPVVDYAQKFVITHVVDSKRNRCLFVFPDEICVLTDRL